VNVICTINLIVDTCTIVYYLCIIVLCCGIVLLFAAGCGREDTEPPSVRSSAQ